MNDLVVFSQAWAEAFGRELDASDAYRQAAADWEGSLAFILGEEAGEAEAAVFLDLWHGECRAARAASETDLDAASYWVRGDAVTWERVLGREIEPLFAIMSGRLALDRGSLASLLPFAAAARELVACASAVGGSMP